MPDYMNLNSSTQAICPKCGELIRVKIKDDSSPYADEWCSDIKVWSVCRCSNCRIRGDSSDYPLERREAWSFPKDYVPTATDAQLGYIRFLAFKLDISCNYIADYSVANEWIHQAVELYTVRMQHDMYLERIEATIAKNCFNVANYDYRTDTIESWFQANVGGTGTAKLFTTIYLKDQTIKSYLEIDLVDEQMVHNTITELYAASHRLESDLWAIEYPSKAEAAREIERNRQRVSARRNLYRID